MLREKRQGGAARRARVRARAGAVLLHAAAPGARPGPRRPAARAFVGDEPFVVALGDSIIGLDRQSDIVRRMREAFDEQRRGRGDRVRRGAARRGAPLRHRAAARTQRRVCSSSRISSRSRAPRDAPSTLAIAARYVLSPAIFDALERRSPGVGGEIQLTDAIRAADSRRRPGLRRACCGPTSGGSTSATSTPTFARSSSSRWPIRSTGRRCARSSSASSAGLDDHHPQARLRARRRWSATRPTATTARPSRSSSATSGRRSCSTSGTRSTSC